MLTNVCPRQIKRIPWPWTNEYNEYGPMAVKPASIPLEHMNLTEYFDWSIMDYSTVQRAGLNKYFDGYSTQNLKSIFNTAVRWLGLETVLVDKPSLFPVEQMFSQWNWRLMVETMAEDIQINTAIIGDDIGTSHGPLFSPEHFMIQLKPSWERLIEILRTFDVTNIVLHSDGDIYEIIPMLWRMGFTHLHPVEMVGKMTSLRDRDEYCGLTLIHDVPYLDEPAIQPILQEETDGKEDV